MAQSRSRRQRVGVTLLFVISGLVTAVGSGPASADVTTVKGSALGYYTDVGLFGGAKQREGAGQVPCTTPPNAANPGVPADCFVVPTGGSASTSDSPAVTLPAGGSATPITASDPDGATAQYGPAKLLSGQYPNAANDPTQNQTSPPSGPLAVSTVGTTGPTGMVTSTASVGKGTQGTADPTQPRGVGPGPIVADALGSTCTASASGVSASTMITNGIVVLSTDSGGAALTSEPVPANPPVNYTRNGVITNVGDNFRVVYNEQIVGSDGSITVNAVHLSLLGPTAVGDLVIAQSVCGVTATNGATTTTTAAPGATTTTAAPGATTTTAAPGATTTTTRASTTTSTAIALEAAQVTSTTAAAGAAASVNGSACGYFTNVSLFGGPKNLEGCGQPASAGATSASPSVTLPAGGSTTPVTASDPDGATAQYGPAKLFSGQYPNMANDPTQSATSPPSGPMNVSTMGTTAADGKVTSTAAVTQGTQGTADPNQPRGVGPGPVVADAISSTCTASSSGVTASTTVTNGIIVLTTDSGGAALTSEPVPASPPANYTRTGVITNVGDNFRAVYNEQTTGSDGSITVNAVHLFLLGPTAVGDLVIAQSVCGRGAAGAAAAGGVSASGGSVGGGSTASAGSGAASTMATTGVDVAGMVALALLLLVIGGNVRYWAPTPAVVAVRRRNMPWARRRPWSSRRPGPRRSLYR